MPGKEFNLNGFTSVEVGGAFEVEIVRSDSFSVNVTAEDFTHIRVENINGALIIRRQGIEWFAPFHGRPRVAIMMPALSGVTLSGASKGKVLNFDAAGELRMEVTGASHLEVRGLSSRSLDFEVTGASTLTGEIKAGEDAKFRISGASTLELVGAANNIKLKASGASRMELTQFSIQNADVEISGASNVTLSLNGKLNANVSGASNLYWLGSPIMGDIQTSGASNLRRK
jgi:hypothetical protein